MYYTFHYEKHNTDDNHVSYLKKKYFYINENYSLNIFASNYDNRN